MTNNPYVETLISMGYDEADCRHSQKKQFPLTIHGKVYETEEEYQEAIHEFLNGM